MALRAKGALLLLALSVVPPPGGSDPLAEAWAASGLAGREGWALLLSPPIPLRWPAPGEAAVPAARYAYAWRHLPPPAGPRLFELSGPVFREGWPGGAAERLAARHEAVGRAAVRALRGEEFGLAVRAAEALRALPGEAAERELRAALCLWAGLHGPAARAILTRHPGVAEAMRCGDGP